MKKSLLKFPVETTEATEIGVQILLSINIRPKEIRCLFLIIMEDIELDGPGETIRGL